MTDIDKGRRWFLTQGLPKVGMSALAATVLLRDAKGDFIIQPKAKKSQVKFVDIFTPTEPNTVYYKGFKRHALNKGHKEWIYAQYDGGLFASTKLNQKNDFELFIPAYKPINLEKECKDLVLWAGCERNIIYLRKSLQDFIDHVCEYSNLVDGINYFIYDKRINYPFTAVQSQGKKIEVIPYSFTDEDYKLAGISTKEKMVVGLNSEALIKVEWDDGEMAIACVDNKKVVLGSIDV